MNYSAAKAGIIGATKALAQEIGKKQVTVNAVAPGFIKTDMTKDLNENELKNLIPLNRFGLPEEVAEVVCFLASDKSILYYRGGHFGKRRIIHIICSCFKFMNRVVITGIGIYSSIGKNLEEVKVHCSQGRSGIVLDAERKSYGYQSGLTGKVERPNLKGILDRRARVCMPDHAEYAYVSTARSNEKCQVLIRTILIRHEVGIIFGNDSSTPSVIQSADIIREKRDTSTGWIRSCFSVDEFIGNHEPVGNFPSPGCQLHPERCLCKRFSCHRHGLHLIRHGYQDRIICGGSQEINLFCVGSFDALGAFSKMESDPTAASRPFDKNRDGLVPSGGAATLILESLDHALKRGAPILAEVIGYGFSSDGKHISVPDVDGPIRAIIHGHEGCPFRTPAKLIISMPMPLQHPSAIRMKPGHLIIFLGKSKPCVSSTKSMTGHEMWMAGASEIIYSMLMMQNSFVAPNINFEEPDEFSAKLNIATKNH